MFGLGVKIGLVVLINVVPKSVRDADLFVDIMAKIQDYYDMLRALNIPAEDARMVLPNAATTNLVMTANLRAILDFYRKRKPGNGAQAEIGELAERLKEEVVAVEPWVGELFG